MAVISRRPVPFIVRSLTPDRLISQQTIVGGFAGEVEISLRFVISDVRFLTTISTT
jgi:hypothetical protein